LTLRHFVILKVGDAGPLLDMMAATLEKLSSEPLTARSTLQAVSVLALAVAYLPDHLYAHQVSLRNAFRIFCLSSISVLRHVVLVTVNCNRVIIWDLRIAIPGDLIRRSR